MSTTKQPKCQVCHKRIKLSEAALFTNQPDGTREHVHVRCIGAKKATSTIEEAAAA
jgi:hypothetical protein